MKKVFKYSEPDRRSFALTIIYVLVFVGAAVAIWLAFDWEHYTKVLLTAVLTGILILFVLSVPGRIEVTESFVDIRCLVDFTRISMRNIRSVRKLEPSEMKREAVLLGSYGFFGYFGYYLNLRTLRISNLYCTTWSGFVEITDIYEKRYIVSSPNPDALVASIAAAIES